MVFSESTLLFANTTLIAQTTGFFLLLLGFIYVRRKNFKKHDQMAKISIFLGGFSLIWMGFSLVSNLMPIVFTGLTGFLIFFHSVAGTLALFIGLFLVLGEIKKTKITMFLAFFSWTAAMLFGVVLYYSLYV